VMYRLTDPGKNDGRALIEGEIQGCIALVLNAVAPISG
jgi:hypothetical protein